MGFPGGSDGKVSACNGGSIPGSGRSPGEGNGNPLQYSCLENSMERGALEATVHGVAKSRTGLSDFTHSLLGTYYFRVIFLSEFVHYLTVFIIPSSAFRFQLCDAQYRYDTKFVVFWFCFGSG